LPFHLNLLSELRRVASRLDLLPLSAHLLPDVAMQIARPMNRAPIEAGYRTGKTD
jgi:hypothetical protein